MKVYRDRGAIGALLDEYERAVLELRDAISSIHINELINSVNPSDEDPNSKSIQTIY
ncbi:MAG: hypothetical protein M3Q56_08210 [Bacteroidota bacterium]|nr:hypothetical protein [Bacteroidota bacterium]